jgi:hypothetical protein
MPYKDPIKKKEYSKKYYLNIKKKKEKYQLWLERSKISCRKYYLKNKEKENKRCKLYKLKNKEKIKITVNKYYRNRRKKDMAWRLLLNVRTRINHALKGTVKKSKKTTDLIGISIEGLIKHIESTFKQGMSWKKRHLIHIDHIRPCSSFDLSKPEEQAKCFHYTNLQALWAHENLSKSDKFVA